ncbi:hypothetical protein B0H15DRAFT_836802 [Mycena belliarum]|uniref:NAD dependent epimerase/dehydratase n=1 Tax=Mycena belliarum TaxID=1033014 RepID=A0AAD6U4S3_9AGAR|nr:hypothetical protein B0H15DRAFT_836802 [Mycena belliae]
MCVPLHVPRGALTADAPLAAMRTALETLGYRDTHHMQSVLMNPPEVDLWNAAIDAKFHGRGTPYTRADWDQLLGHCQAVTDVPALLFWEELLAAYPDAQVILTTRDPASWWASYRGSLHTFYHWRRVALAMRLDPAHFGKVIGFTQRSVALMLGSLDVPQDVAQARFVAHYAAVRAAVPRERLLEYRVGEGWGRLCAFLGTDVPEGDFPRTNDSEEIKRGIHAWSSRIFRATAVRMIGPAVLALSVGVALFATRGKLW